MRVIVLLIAAALCGQAQEKAGCYNMAGGGMVPCPPSLESRVEKLEKMLAPLNPGCVILASNPPQVSCPAEAGGPSTIVFRDPSLGRRALSREEANALLVALANAINKASAQRAAESRNEENTIKTPGANK